MDQLHNGKILKKVRNSTIQYNSIKVRPMFGEISHFAPSSFPILLIWVTFNAVVIIMNGAISICFKNYAIGPLMV
jgi:hypothetical protein